MTIKRPAVPKPENVQLGEGVLVYNFDPTNWDSEDTIPFGATRGGGSYNVEPTNKPIRFDGDKGEDTMGLKRRQEWKITIVATALELDHAKMTKYMPGKVTTAEATIGVPAYKTYRPNVEFSDADYITNMAYITETKAGNVVAYVIENVLGDGALSAALADKDEVVAETTFTAHFDPEDMNTLPTYVIQYEGETLPEPVV